ncbi:hypothetical protein [Rhodoplanes elegans]|uniref:hypothetical protein n=1 Tax=Rhodoplanes elegans TaxID=29408 RepID=UPI0011B942D4|nr:hypothetical protein [Rhodoplanes elegans]
MNAEDKSHADQLRAALLLLDPSGPNGFEGLLGVVLGHVTGQTFRLARSGSQRGRDGESAFDSGETYFEAKRYTEHPEKSAIAAKLLDLEIDDAGQVDVWILGATCEISTQTAGDLRVAAARKGIGVVVLDWSYNDFGSLLVAVAASAQNSIDFLKRELEGKAKASLVKAALLAIEHFAAHPDLPDRLSALRTALSAEEAGLGHAKAANREWAIKIFSNRRLARAAFGQPLAPLDSSGLPAIRRPAEAELKGAFVGKPEAEIYALVGDEGVGKSWLAVQPWLSCDPRSVLIICPAEELLDREANREFSEFLIRKIIQQTNGTYSDVTKMRWIRRLRMWRAKPDVQNVRITLVVDGLNQPLKADWSRWLDLAAVELQAVGGALVVTTRAAHWAYIKNALESAVKVVNVVGWTGPELITILRRRGICPDGMKAEVLDALRNPRILSIAVGLLDSKEVELFDELSVGRLMFEYMRKVQQTGAAPISGPEFADLLKYLASKAISRVQSQERDDIKLFNVDSHVALQAVASGNFFRLIKGTAQEYEINQDGLILGIALFLNMRLEGELRNGRNPRGRLAVIIEPIAALDEVAKIIFVATQIACLDESTGPEVRAALLEQFVSLQNLPNDEVVAFYSLARKAPASFLAAMESVHSSEVFVPNNVWLLRALIMWRDEPAVWADIATSAKRWLSLYSLAPERMMFRTPGRDPAEEVRKERDERLRDIDKRQSALTDVEKEYIAINLELSAISNLDALQNAVFYLIAGKPLLQFAPHLMRWSVSNSLAPAIQSPHDEYRQLIRFNKIDWSATRAALLNELMSFGVDVTSQVGKWARVEVLRATGDLEDAQEAEILAESLTRDRERFGGWSRIEGYCSVDPCDPTTEKPLNVDETAKQYKSIIPSTVAIDRARGLKDHFFEMARTGVARFHVDAATVAHRALADDVLTRSGLPRMQGAYALLGHSGALLRSQAERYLAAGLACTVRADCVQERDEWYTAQYFVLIAFPHLMPDEQLEAVAAIKGGTVLSDITDALLKPSAEAAERVLEDVLRRTDEDAQAAVLAAINRSRPPLTPRARSIVLPLIESRHTTVRAEAIGVAAAYADVTLLEAVIASGWSAHSVPNRDRTYERWHGSSALIEAAKAGLVDIETVFDRIDIGHYGIAARVFGAETANMIGLQLDESLKSALGYVETPEIPEITAATRLSSEAQPPMISLSEPVSLETLSDKLRSLKLTEEQLEQRRERVLSAFRQFANEIEERDAQLVIANLTEAGLGSIFKACPGINKRWLEMLISANDIQLRHLHNLAAHTALSLVCQNSEAETLFRRLMKLAPTVRHVEGMSKIPSECLSLWRKAECPTVRKLCRERLLASWTDEEVASEVLTAYLAGRSEIVFQTIDELLADGHPADMCRALTLAGFSDSHPYPEEIISRFEGARGYIGSAQRAAREAYRKNDWAKSWFQKMIVATDPAMFWQASVLLTKIVDGRYEIWGGNIEGASEVFYSFYPSIEHDIKHRIERWTSKRQKKLFGDSVPAKALLWN